MLVLIGVIVVAVLNTMLSKLMLEPPEESVFAKATASRRLSSPAPGARASLESFTTSAAKAAPAFVRSNEAEPPEADATTT